MAISKKETLGFINGNPEDITKVYLEYKNLLFFIIANYVDNIEDCNDVLSETFMKAMQNAKSFNKDNSLKYYLCTIAKNEAINFAKQHSREVEIQDEEIFIDSEKGDALNYLEPLLTKKEIIVVYYKAVFNYTWPEIASETKLSESTVRSIYREAKDKLRKEYSNL